MRGPWLTSVRLDDELQVPKLLHRSYNQAGKLLSEQNESGDKTQYRYDSLDRLTGVVLPMAAISCIQTITHTALNHRRYSTILKAWLTHFPCNTIFGGTPH